MKRRPLRSSQNGVALVIGLITLIVVMMLGISASQSSALQEKMAGNTRNRELAFQSAEAALSYAADALTSKTFLALPSTYLAADGSVTTSEHINDKTFWTSATLWTAATCATKPVPCRSLPSSGGTAVNIDPVAEQPLYYVERLPDYSGYATYRITARSVGGTSDTPVILQATYRIP